MNTDPSAPPQRCVSNVRIDKTIPIDHAEALKKLGRYRHAFATRNKFWVEVAVLDRLNYKGKNQQRHFHRFKRSCEARRLIKRIQRLEVDKVLNHFYTLFWNEAALEKCIGRPHPPTTTIPTREFCEYVMQTLIASAILLDKLQVVLVEVYREYTTLLKLEHFVSLALVQLGISARLYTLAHKWVNELTECYQLIQRLHLAYPYGSKKTGCLYRCEPTTMKTERAKAEQWIENRLSFKSPVHFEFFLTHRIEGGSGGGDHSILEKGAPEDIHATVAMGEEGNTGDDDLGEIIARD